MTAGRTGIEIGLTAAIVSIQGDEPQILVAGDGDKSEPRAGLPSGPFDPLAHHTFEIGLRSWVQAQTALAARRSARHPLLRRHQPLDGGGVHCGVYAQSASR